MFRASRKNKRSVEGPTRNAHAMYTNRSIDGDGEEQDKSLWNTNQAMGTTIIETGKERVKWTEAVIRHDICISSTITEA